MTQHTEVLTKISTLQIRFKTRLTETNNLLQQLVLTAQAQAKLQLQYSTPHHEVSQQQNSNI
jgi:hypothetical protein